MHQSKLLKLLRILEPGEFRKFYKFVRSIYFQNNTNLVKLYKILRNHYPDFPPEKVTKEKIFKKIFPNRPYNLNTIATLMSKLTKLVEEYLLVCDLNPDPFTRKKRLVKIYGKRNQIELFEKGTKELIKELDQAPFPDHLQKIELYHSYYFHPIHDKYNLEDHTLEYLIGSLDSYYTLAKMRYAIAFKSKQKILSVNYKESPLEAQYKEQGNIPNPSLLLTLYEFAFELLEGYESLDFSSFENLFFDNIKILSREDQLLLYINGLNYINRQVNNGKHSLSKVAFKWYQWGLKNDLIIENKTIDETTFSNIVIYGCREKMFNWTKSFIQDYQRYLNAEIRASTVFYNLACWHFFNHDYEKTLSILSDIKFPEKDQPKVRLFIIRTLFELFLKSYDYYNVLLSNIHSFEMYIYRNQYFKERALIPYLNCIKIIRSLAKKISNKECKAQIKTSLLKQTKSKTSLIASDWLSEKVNQL